MDDDRCYECTANGDDYYLDGNNEWVKACDDCPFNSNGGAQNNGDD